MEDGAKGGMNSATRILVVDDEQDLVWAIQHSLCDEGYEVFTAYNGVEALDIAENHPPDLVILDIILPRLDGLEVCRRLRRQAQSAAVPILFLTTRKSVEARVEGLDEGGDDYLTKPFDLGELKARVRALLRRKRSNGDCDQESPGQVVPIAVGDLQLRVPARRVRVRDRVVQLTPAEFDLLHYLMTHVGQLFSSQQLSQQALGYPQSLGDSSLVRWHIRNLRQKIEPDPAEPVYIRTVPCQGYIFEDCNSSV